MLRESVERAPDHPALIDGDRVWSYAALAQHAEAAAAWLRDADIRPGDRVILVCENGRAAIALFFAIVELGAWPILVSARIAARELAEIQAHSGARRIVYTVAAAPLARQHATRDAAAISVIEGLGEIGLGAIDADAMPEPANAVLNERIAALVYTSGTTGRPKGVLLTHRNLLYVAEASGAIRQLVPEDRVYAILPISHILGLVGVILSSLMYGATLHLAPRFDPAALLRAIGRENVSFVLGTPAMYALLLEYAKRNGIQTIEQPALRLISSAGAPLDLPTKEATEKLFGRPLYNGYGITECGPTISLTPLAEPRTDCAVGRLMPGIEAKLRAPEGGPLAAGEPGELWLRGPGIMQGYYRAADETAQVLDAEGWFNTRDLARIENDDLFIVGRTKELIIRFGFNVYPAEIEAVLSGHPGVAQCAVVARPGENDPEIVAFVRPIGGSALSPNELMAFCAARLATYKRPSEIRIVDALPVSPTGKILKQELAAQAML